MHAFLIVGGGKEVGKKISEITSRLEAKEIETPIVKIEDIRAFVRSTRTLLPQKTAFVVRNIDKATIPAQNAFLKHLEEPQEKAYFILTAQNSEAVLPTIASRCQKIVVSSKQSARAQQENAFDDFVKETVGGRLLITSKIMSREAAKDFLLSFLMEGKTKLPKNPKFSKLLSKALEAYENIEKNGNVQILKLENKDTPRNVLQEGDVFCYFATAKGLAMVQTTEPHYESSMKDEIVRGGKNDNLPDYFWSMYYDDLVNGHFLND